MRWTCKTTAWITGTESAWRLVEAQGQGAARRTVELTIEGSEGTGFHLVKDPEGHFAADLWFETADEAKAEALESLGVKFDEWS